jgi:hypothetical protein
MHVAPMGEKTNAYKILVVRFEVSTAVTMMIIIFWEMIIIKILVSIPEEKT